MMRSLLYFIRSIVILITSPLLVLWYVRYWFKRHIKDLTNVELKTPTLVGFTDKMFYSSDDTLKLFLSSENKKCVGVKVCKIESQKKEILLQELTLKVGNQVSDIDSANSGCDWCVTTELVLKGYSQGYYKLYLDSCSNITFIIGSNKPTNSICIVAPVSTWVAYNHYGGQSAYDNYLDDKNVYSLSTLRPNLALEYNDVKNIHDMNVESNIFNWFNTQYDVSIIPDYALEYEKVTSNIIVLSYHCEYFSSKMYKGLNNISKNSSIISLGANQVYWKIKWNNDYTKMEVRKDMTFFDSSFDFGGKWRHSLFPEDKLLNASYTDSGIGTFAPYKVLKPNHWLFDGVDLSYGDLFGASGINELGICGDETDKCTRISSLDVEVIAKGMNCKDGELYEQYDSEDSKWNSEGGGELSFRLTNNNKGILNTGAIQSGSGLGVDEVFTKVIQNFITRYNK